MSKFKLLVILLYKSFVKLNKDIVKSNLIFNCSKRLISS